MPGGIGNRKLSELELILNKIWCRTEDVVIERRVELINLVASGKGCHELAYSKQKISSQ